MEQIPYIAFESAQARLERTIRRLWIALLLVVILLVASNCAWIYYESQFETVQETSQKVTQENTNGVNTFVGGDVNGDTDGNNNN